MRSSNTEKGSQQSDVDSNADAKISENTAPFSSSSPVATSTQTSIAVSMSSIQASAAPDLLVVLADAFKPIVEASQASVSSALWKESLALTFSTLPTNVPPKRDPTSTSSTLTTDSVDDSSSSSTPEPAGLPSNRVGRLLRRELNPYNPVSDVALSMLHIVSNLVANIAGISIEPAAALADAMLAVLPLDAEAISSSILAVADQASVSVEAVVPFILPAIERARGNSVEGYIPIGNPGNLNDTFKDIITQGSIVINQITTASALTKDPIMEDILKQVADIVYAVARYSEQGGCTPGRDDAGLHLDAFVSCKPPSTDFASGNILTLDLTSSTSGRSGPATTSWNVLSTADSEAYDKLSDVVPSTYSISLALSPTGTEMAKTSSSASPSVPKADYDFGVAVSGWTYLGCFQDAISRTLVGSKPVDYLRGSMSNLTCINHCATSGYSFAGTEHGFECWCGLSIRDDAVRLPESSCNVLCQDCEKEFCGGSWVISVFRCSESDAEPGPRASISAIPEAGQDSRQLPGSSSTMTRPPLHQQSQPPSTVSSATPDSLAYEDEGEGVHTSSAGLGPIAKLLAKTRHF
ncbi:Carbohydrate-binding WSC [Metarhizium rileyi]|uniref:Carbohydrate-binding WSC n=1 Tax=Metarhizium rileyi (strain RCEF 4871) TaxID=1649241 RepID=A0A167HFV0_METRR|nr:Carbohydrate-binding WSC [Metarhizium rileyi RCEF 4871]